MSLICGIDEARRGPIIGPMVMCGAFIEEKDMQKLTSLNPKDSKLLTPQEREELYSPITKILKDFTVFIIHPEEIDRAVNGKGGLNLNKLEAHKQAEILNTSKPDKAIIDCPSNNIQSYRAYLKNQLHNKKIELVLEHHAECYPLVAAASIIAKVTGDAEIEKIKKQIGIDFGSGYMSDPKTVAFLQKYYELHSAIFRKSWFPYQEMLNKKFQKSLSDFTQFLKEDQKHHGHTIEDIKKLEEFGFHFDTSKSEQEIAIMKGPCTVILYKNGKLLIQGNADAKKNVEKLLGM